MPNVSSNVFRLQKDEIEKPIERTRAIHQSDLVPLTIKQRHCEGWMVFPGTAANRPDGSTHCKAYFATDTGVFSLWDGSDWLDTTLS